MTDTVIKMTKDEFDATYKLRRNHLNADSGWAFGDDGGCLFETYGEALDFVQKQPPGTVWTLVDGDDGEQYLLSGFHVVNRIGYLVSTVPAPDGADIRVALPPAESAAASAKPEAALTRYTVHVYREMRVKFEGIEAASPEEAADQARDLPTELAREFVDCEGEDFCTLVDVLGDEDYAQSRIIDCGGERNRKVACVMRVALGRLVTAADSLAAAIDGATDQFADETTQLESALRSARDALAGTRYPDPANPPPLLVPLRADLRNLDAVLGQKGMVALIWSIADVKELRPDLTDEQAYDVLTYAQRHHDAQFGMNWDTFELIAEDLFPEPDDTDSTDNQ